MARFWVDPPANSIIDDVESSRIDHVLFRVRYTRLSMTKIRQAIDRLVAPLLLLLLLYMGPYTPQSQSVGLLVGWLVGLSVYRQRFFGFS